MRIPTTLAIGAVVLTMAMPLAVAEQTTPTRIADLARGPIAITGKVQAVFGNTFVLDDGTGQVLVEAGPRWYHTLDVKAGETLTVTGKPDDETFDAVTIRHADGRIRTIRPVDGPPPWAGGPRRAGRE